jgi:glutamate-1-semialdehyde 2,1-aminomutase
MSTKLKILGIIQVRVGSTRFPGKVIKKYKGVTYLEILIKRLKRTKNIKKIIVATSKNSEDDQIKKICDDLKVFCFRGSNHDVIDRYYKASKIFKTKNILRITGDCPLIDPEIVDQVIYNYFLRKASYATNTMPATFPDGLDVEVFSFEALKTAWLASRKNKRLREHVTTHIRENKYLNKINISFKKDYSFLRLTLDEPQDLKVINFVLSKFSKNYKFKIDDIIKIYENNKDIFDLNMKIKRNEGKNLITGQKVWKRAKNIIPNGSMLLSKNPDLFLPEKWPAYFSKTKGCKIWDLDNNVLDDISYMGVGTNILGYNYPDVEKKVIQTIKNGTMSTLNSIEEILLAEKLISMHPWADMARFTRSGGEANAVAIRIARAASGKEKVAICGYHGWHDWYLSSNLVNKSNLDNHLMPNVPIEGVPKNLKETVFPFEYNNYEQLEKIVKENDIGVIKMEVERNLKPKNNFLEKIRKLSKKKSIVLIFDECTSGFRKTFGGLHMHYNVKPDICIFGKALGNGYAINAIIGKRSVMEACKKSFISSTFWTERIGPTAALQTLKSMEKIKSWELITEIGNTITKNWKKISNLHGIKMNVSGLSASPNFLFKSEKHHHYKTLISQEMLKKKIMASNLVFCSIAHNEKVLNRYFDCLDDIFSTIKKCENQEEDINKILESKVCLSGIRNS